MKKTISIVLAALLMLTVFTGCVSKEKQAAIDEYTKAVDTLNEKNAELDTAVAEANELIKKAEPAFDEKTLLTLETATAEAKAAKVSVPEKMPSKVEEINAAKVKLSKADYSTQLAALKQAKDAYQTSVQQLKQITAPKESFVIDRLKAVKGIIGVAAVTEDNDPNGHLGKQGGYTAQIFFTYDAVDKSELFSSDIIENGTDGGGSVEVYANAADAIERETYLAGFDGGVLASGSHAVYGTVLIRTSDHLKASEQKALEKAILESLIRIEK